MKQAMIFAAGLGTRLKPLTDTMPKALVPVGGQPLLWHVVMKLKTAGFERIVVNVHHFAQHIIDYLSSNGNFGLDIRISDETGQLLETGGGIRKALPLFDCDEPILVHNVDILSNVDLGAFYDNPYPRHADAVLLVSPRVTKRYLLFDRSDCLVGWINRDTGQMKSPFQWLINSELTIDNDLSVCHSPFASHRSPFSAYAFSGIHVMMPELFPLMETWPERFPIIDFYLHHCDEADIRCAVKTDLRLLDVGKLDTLEQANDFILNSQLYATEDYHS